MEPPTPSFAQRNTPGVIAETQQAPPTIKMAEAFGLTGPSLPAIGRSCFLFIPDSWFPIGTMLTKPTQPQHPLVQAPDLYRSLLLSTGIVIRAWLPHPRQEECKRSWPTAAFAPYRRG